MTPRGRTPALVAGSSMLLAALGILSGRTTGSAACVDYGAYARWVGHAEISGYPVDVVVAGNCAYLASESGGLHIVDISDSSTPREIADVPPDQLYDQAYGVAVAGSYAYVVHGHSGLRVIDVSNPANPVVAGAVDTPGLAHGVDVRGTLAYVADWGGLKVIDVSDPASPRIIGSVETPGQAYDVTISGTSAYLAGGSGGLLVIDISDPTSPRVMGSIPEASYACNVVVEGDRAYVATWASGVWIVDVSDPAHL
jgi:hypothetical protein